jgi:hypothetical protein
LLLSINKQRCFLPASSYYDSIFPWWKVYHDHELFLLQLLLTWLLIEDGKWKWNSSETETSGFNVLPDLSETLLIAGFKMEGAEGLTRTTTRRGEKVLVKHIDPALIQMLIDL